MLAIALSQALLMAVDAAMLVVLAVRAVEEVGALGAGVLAAAGGLPWLLMSGFGGQLADRAAAAGHRRRQLAALSLVAGGAGLVLLSTRDLSGWPLVAVWSVMVAALGSLETVRNSLARLALLDLDVASTAGTRFARIDRAAFQIGVTAGGLLGAVLVGLPLGATAAVTVVGALVASAVLAAASPPEREGSAAPLRAAFRVRPPRELPQAMAAALLLLTFAGLFGQQRQTLWPIIAEDLGGGPVLGWMTAAAALAGLVTLALTFRTYRALARGVVAGSGLMTAVAALMALSSWAAGPAAVTLAVLAAAAHGAAVALLLVSTRQLAALLSPPGQVGEVSGWTSMPMNGFPVVTGPLLALAAGYISVTTVWSALTLALVVSSFVVGRRLLTA